MRRLLYVAAGFVGGVVVSRNAAAMPAPAVPAVLLGVALVLVLAWWAGRRDKHGAIASAVAVAVAKATAVSVSESQAAAVASSQLHLHMGSAGVEGGGAERGAPVRALEAGQLVALPVEMDMARFGVLSGGQTRRELRRDGEVVVDG